jgi:siroheme synthase
VAARLIAAGLAPTTRAVAIANASRADEQRVFAPLCQLAARLAAQGFTGPTLVLMGAVVDMAQENAAMLARAA